MYEQMADIHRCFRYTLLWSIICKFLSETQAFSCNNSNAKLVHLDMTLQLTLLACSLKGGEEIIPLTLLRAAIVIEH